MRSQDLFYKNLAKELKSLELIKIDLRRKLTPAKKGQLTKLAKKTKLDANLQKLYKERYKIANKDKLINYKPDMRKALTVYDRAKLIDTPKQVKTLIKHRDEFVRRKVSKANAKLLAENGYLVKSQYAFIPVNNYDKVRIGKYMGKLAIFREIPKRGKNNKILAKARKQQIDIIVKPRGILDFLNELEAKYPNKLPKGMFLTARVGTNNPIGRQFNSVAELKNYSEHGLMINLAEAGIDTISLVIIND